MDKLTWAEFNKKLDSIYFDNFDYIVAIANGGVIPAAFIQRKLEKPMMTISIQYRDKDNNPKHNDALLMEYKEFPIKDKKILLVDDVIRSGKTIKKAKEYLKGNEIKTFAVNGDADYSLFDQKRCIIAPWK